MHRVSVILFKACIIDNRTTFHWVHSFRFVNINAEQLALPPSQGKTLVHNHSFLKYLQTRLVLWKQKWSYYISLNAPQCLLSRLSLYFHILYCPAMCCVYSNHCLYQSYSEKCHFKWKKSTMTWQFNSITKVDVIRYFFHTTRGGHFSWKSWKIKETRKVYTMEP